MIALLVGSLAVDGKLAVAQQSVVPMPQIAASAQVSLAAIVDDLPAHLEAVKDPAFEKAIENATAAERDGVLPELMGWVDDKRPEVRGIALLMLDLLYLPTEQQTGWNGSVPVRYIPAVAAHLLDPDPRLCRVAFAALQPVTNTRVGLDELVRLVLPMLRNPEAVADYRDTWLEESDTQILANMKPEQQAEFKAMRAAHPPKPTLLPPLGEFLLAILAAPTVKPSKELDDAMIAFLKREDQTKNSLQGCLHSLAISSASERVNDVALTQVFEKKAMTIYLLQFVNNLQLSPEQLVEQKVRLLSLSNDETAKPGLRKSAREVAACWTGDRHVRCAPSDMNLREQLDSQ